MLLSVSNRGYPNALKWHRETIERALNETSELAIAPLKLGSSHPRSPQDQFRHVSVHEDKNIE
jgi:hypothetical protein